MVRGITQMYTRRKRCRKPHSGSFLGKVYKKKEKRESRTGKNKKQRG